MFDWILALTWCLYIKNHSKAYRFCRGGLWVHFDNDSWVRCKWYYPHVGEYIEHPQDKGMFSVKLKNIVRLEDYPWGHAK